MDLLDILKAWGPTAGVAVVCVLLVLNAKSKSEMAQNTAMSEWGKSRDEERKLFIEELRAERVSRDAAAEQFTGAIVMLVQLAYTVVTQCQHGVADDKKVTPQDITDAGKLLTKGVGGGTEAEHAAAQIGGRRSTDHQKKV